MNKLSTLSAVAALAVATAAPVTADEAEVNSDPFVSSQGAFGGLGSIGTGIVLTVGIFAFVAMINESGPDTILPLSP